MEHGKNNSNPILEASEIMKKVKQSSKEAINSILEEKLRTEIEKIIKESPDDYTEEDIQTDVVEEPNGEVDVEQTTEAGDEDGLTNFEVGEGEYDITDVGDAATILKIIDGMEDGADIIVTRVGDALTVEGDGVPEAPVEDVVEEPAQVVDEPVEEPDDEPEYEVNEAVLPFKTNYQKKPAMTTPSFKNPNPESTREWDKVPGDGNKKLGNIGKGKPFNESDELDAELPVDASDDEIVSEDNVRTKMNLRQHASVKPQQAVKYAAGVRVDKVRQGAKLVDESKVMEALQKIQKENRQMKTDNAILTETVKQFKEVAVKFYTTLRETALTNAKLGKIVKLFAENSTTIEEKRSIIDRFETGKTEEDVTKLYETITKELKNQKTLTENIRNTAANNDPVVAPVDTKQLYINEAAAKVVQLMQRVDSI